MADEAAGEPDGINIKTFEAVDDAAKVRDYIGILDAFDILPGIQRLKNIGRQRARVGSGMQVLDSGCGTGLETARLARLVAPSGMATGTDISHDLLAEAQRRAAGMNLPVAYREGDAEQLPFADGTFDVARAERVLPYLTDPAKALAELARVTKPGGTVYVLEPDFETVTINIDDRDLVRRVVQFDCDNDSRHGWIGRHLPAMFAAAGLTDVEVEPGVVVFEPVVFSSYFRQIGRAAGQAAAITAVQVQQWEDAITALLDQGALFGTVTYFLVMGRR